MPATAPLRGHRNAKAKARPPAKDAPCGASKAARSGAGKTAAKPAKTAAAKANRKPAPKTRPAKAPAPAASPDQIAYFETAFRGVSDAVILGDTERRVVKCNPAFTRLFGYGLAEMQGRVARFIYAAEAEFERLGRDRFNPDVPEQPEPYVVAYRRKDGTVFSGETVGAPVRDEQGRLLGYIAIIRNITPEMEGKRDEERIRRVLGSLGEGIAFYDSDDTLIFCNEEYRRIHPLISDLLLPGARYEDVVRAHAERGAISGVKKKAEIDAHVRERMEIHRNPKEPIIRELSDGTWFIIRESRTPDGGVYAITTDITQLKRIETDLRASQEQFVNAVAALQEGFALYDADDRLVLCNDQYRHLHPKVGDILKPGMKFEDLVRANIERGVNADAIGREEEHIRERLKQHRNPKEPIVRTLTDGTTFVIKENRTPEGGIVVTETDITPRRKAEEAQERLWQAVERVPVGVALFDGEDQLVFSNSRYREFLAPLADILKPGVRFETLVHALAERGGVRNAFGRVDAYVQERMDSHRKPRGSIDLMFGERCVQVNETRMSDGGTLIMLIDITDQRRADEALRKSEERMRGAIESLQEGFALFDADDRLVAVNEKGRQFNPSAAEVLEKGGTFEDLIRANLERGVLLEAIGREDEFLRYRMKAHRNPTGPIIRRMKGGGWFMLNEARTPEGGIALSFIDITELKEAEIALRRSRQQFKDFAEAASDWLWEMDENLRFSYCSGRNYEITGQRPEDVIGRTRQEMAGADADNETWRRHLADLEARRPFHDFCYELTKPDGTVIFISSSGKPIFDDDGEFTGYRGTGTDITARVEAETALRASEERFRNLAEGSIQGIVVHRDHAPLFVNRAYAEIFGYDSPDEILTKDSVLDLFPPYEQERLRRYKKARMLGAYAPVAYEVQAIRRDGMPIWLENQVRVIDWKGEPATQTTTIDITERKTVEEALRISEGRFRDVAESAGDWIWEMGADLRFTYLSRRFYELFSIAPEQIIGKTRDQFAHAPDDDNWRRHLADIAARKPFRDFEYALETPDGRTRFIRVSGKPVFGHDNDFRGYRGTGTDITVETEAAAAAAKAQAHLFDAIESITAGVALFDRDDRLVLCNTRYQQTHPAMGHLTKPGTTFEEIIRGVAAAGLYHEAMGPVDAFIEKRLALHHNAPSNHEQQLSDGRWVDIHEYRTHDSGTVLIWTDITDRKVMERQLSGSQRMESLGKLTGGVAHDFNNLLTVILGNLQLMERRIPDDQKLLRHVELATGAAQRGAELTTRLLAFARRQRLDTAVLDVNVLISGLEGIVTGTLGETVTLETDLSDRLWPVKIDPTQFENALLNLAINARDAMPMGGTLRIETANMILDQRHAGQYPDAAVGDFVMIAVGDDGVGMTADVIDHAFEPFFTTKDVGKGTGLGLSMVYGFVKQLNGYVRIESEPGHGTTVKLFLPRFQTAAAEIDESEDDPELPFGEETILVVEDDADVRQTTVSLLEECGYSVVEAEDGPTALGVLDTLPAVDLLLTDVVMPGGMKGPDLAREARKRRHGLKVLFMSGYAEYGALMDGEIEGEGPLLSKPFQKSDLAAKVRQVIDS